MATTVEKNAAKDTPAILQPVGIVLIGRNEGERLKMSIRSVIKSGAAIVYVDSGSTDGSVEFALSEGISVVNLDMSKPFTAARARNAGFHKLIALSPDTAYVHFIDGDCVLEPGWLDVSVAFLNDHPEVALVCGIRSEIHPDASIYNWICDLEWHQPAGETTVCGGDALIRASAFRDVGGFNNALLASEEPELCIRLRKVGWRIWRLPDNMTRHDASMIKFSQFWKRAVRSGYGHSMVNSMYWATRSGLWLTGIGRPIVYSIVPFICLALAIWIGPFGFLPLMIYPLQIVRIASRRDIGDIRCWKYAALVTISKFAEVKGILAFLWDVMTGKTRKIIEYK